MKFSSHDGFAGFPPRSSGDRASGSKPPASPEALRSRNLQIASGGRRSVSGYPSLGNERGLARSPVMRRKNTVVNFHFSVRPPLWSMSRPDAKTASLGSSAAQLKTEGTCR